MAMIGTNKVLKVSQRVMLSREDRQSHRRSSPGALSARLMVAFLSGGATCGSFPEVKREPQPRALPIWHP